MKMLKRFLAANFDRVEISKKSFLTVFILVETLILFFLIDYYDNFSFSSDLRVIIGIIFFILFPITLFETLNIFTRFKLPRINLIFVESIKWLFGSFLVYFLYFINFLIFKIEIFDLVILSTILCFAIQLIIYSCINSEKAESDYLKFDVKSKIPKKTFLINTVGISLMFLYYSLFFNNWGSAKTQMTDLFNHNTVVNELNNGGFAFFPSSLTESIQLSAYTNIFHSVLGVARVFFESEYLFEFQYYFQFLLLVLFFFIFKKFLIKIANVDEIIAVLGSLLMLIPNSPNLSFNRFAIAPNQVVVFLIPTLIILLLNRKYKWFVASFSVLFLHHFFSTAMSLAVFIPLILWNIKKPKFLFTKNPLRFINIFLSIFSLFAILNIVFFKINFTNLISNYATVLGFSEDSLITSGSKNLWSPIFSGFISMSPFLLVALIFLSIFYVFLIDNKYLWLKIPTSIFFGLFLLPIPFSGRFTSIIIVTALPLVVISVKKLFLSKSKQLLALFILVILSSSWIFMATKNHIYLYYNNQFWTKEELNIILEAKTALSSKGIDSTEVYVLSEPMTKMLAQSTLHTGGSGTYMRPEEREKVYNFIENRKFYCGEDNEYKYMLFIYTSRVYQWKLNPKNRISEINNLWYYTGEDYNSNLDIRDFDSSFLIGKMIERKEFDGMLFIITKC